MVIERATQIRFTWRMSANREFMNVIIYEHTDYSIITSLHIHPSFVYIIIIINTSLSFSFIPIITISVFGCLLPGACLLAPPSPCF